MQKILRNVYNIVFFTYNRCFACLEAVNLVQKLLYTVMLKWHSNYTHRSRTA